MPNYFVIAKHHAVYDTDGVWRGELERVDGRRAFFVRKRAAKVPYPNVNISSVLLSLFTRVDPL